MHRPFLINVVGAAGFELATLWSQTRCATRLRYAPKDLNIARFETKKQASAKKCFYLSPPVLEGERLWNDSNPKANL